MKEKFGIILVDKEYTTCVLTMNETTALMRDLLINYGGRLVRHDTKKDLYDYMNQYFKGLLADDF